MTTTIPATKENVEALIACLGGEKRLWVSGTPIENPVLLGDVLEKIHIHAFTCGIPGKNLYSLELRVTCMELWEKCVSASESVKSDKMYTGFTKSLQTISEESGWRVQLKDIEPISGDGVMDSSDLDNNWLEMPATPEARALAEFLLSIFPPK